MLVMAPRSIAKMHMLPESGQLDSQFQALVKDPEAGLRKPLTVRSRLGKLNPTDTPMQGILRKMLIWEMQNKAKHITK